MSVQNDATPKDGGERGSSERVESHLVPPGALEAIIERLPRWARWMKDSTTFPAIVAEGWWEPRLLARFQVAHRLLRRIGEDRFGSPPTPEQQAVLEAITAPERLEELVLGAPGVASWADLLSPTPAPAPRRGRRKKA